MKNNCLLFTIYSLLFIGIVGTASAVNIVSRTAPASRARMPNVATQIQNNVATESAPVETPTETAPVAPVIENKSDRFATTLKASDISANSRNNAIAEQRAALDAADAMATAATTMKRNLQTGANVCNDGLRKCMQSKCGDDFTKCITDGDTVWGQKLDACRRDLKCTGNEFNLFGAEIKSDRDANVKIASYTETIKCGDEYNNCIITNCGSQMQNCIGQTAATNAIAKCKSVSDKCKTADSGLIARIQSVFGTLRGNAEKTIASDEKRLMQLREQMATTCRQMGALFDERSMDCVYTVNFYAGDNTLFASRKAYAGDLFTCTPDWFGIDITTYMENAGRLTREQTSASSALMGAGLGVAAGAISSGAINRAMDTHRAEHAVDKAEDATEAKFSDDFTISKEEKQAVRDAKNTERAAQRAEKMDGDGVNDGTKVGNALRTGVDKVGDAIGGLFKGKDKE